jgi:hypothetical protein
MKHRNPPRIATWLLTRLSGCDEALVGDLIEEYRRVVRSNSTAKNGDTSYSSPRLMTQRLYTLVGWVP